MGEKQIQKRDKIVVILFAAFTLGAGFIGKAIDTLLTDKPEGQSLGMLIWLVLPLIVSIIIRLSDKGHFESVGFKPSFLKNRSVYAIALFIFPIITVLSIGIAFLFGSITINNCDKTLMGGVIIGAIFKNLVEEITWRGNMVPFFEKMEWNDYLFYLVTGLIWGCWHIPYYLFYAGIEDGLKLKTIISGIVIMILWTPLFVEVRRITKSFWPAYLLHLTEECVPMLLFVAVGVFKINGFYDVVMNPINGIIPTILICACGVYMGKQLKK